MNIFERKKQKRLIYQNLFFPFCNKKREQKSKMFIVVEVILVEKRHIEVEGGFGFLVVEVIVVEERYIEVEGGF